LLNQLVGSSFPSSEKIHTRGLSFAFPKEDRHNKMGSKFLLLDTAGANSPLEKIEIDEEWESGWKEEFKNQIIEGRTKEAKEEEDPDRLGDSEMATLQKELKVARAHKMDDMRKQNIVDKKGTEEFLQRLVFDLADITIIVVNEMTWPDQQYIEVLSHQLEEQRIARV